MATVNDKAVKSAALGMNPHFTEASASFIDISRMLMELGNDGLLPEQMRFAILQHAENNRDAIPLNISGMAATLAAAAAGNFGVAGDQVAKTAWAIVAMTEQLQGWQELAHCFGDESPNGRYHAKDSA